MTRPIRPQAPGEGLALMSCLVALLGEIKKTKHYGDPFHSPEELKMVLELLNMKCCIFGGI